MKIAININPLKNAHKDRGIGYYTSNLVKFLSVNSQLRIQQFTEFGDIKDANIIHYPWFDFFFNTLPKNKKIPQVVTIHDVIPLKFKQHHPVGIKGRINFFLQKRALKSCSAIITDSKISKTDIAKYLSVDSAKIFVVPLAIDEDFKIISDAKLIHIKRKYDLKDRFLLYVGDANWIKNIPFLIEGFKNITDKPEYKNLKLVLVGGVFKKNVENIDHPELESLKKVNRLIREYQLEDKVIKTGKIEKNELIALYNLAIVYIQPSIYEGFGLPVLEAMSCGAPVVCSNGGSLPEVGGEAAVYFDPNNLKQFEQIMLEVLEDKSLRNRLSELSLEQAKKFSWEKVAAKTLQVYSNVTNL